MFVLHVLFKFYDTVLFSNNFQYLYSLLNDKKKHSKYLVLGLGARRTFWLSSRTLRIPYNVLSRTNNISFFDYCVR